ncbi:MAG: stage III sporulation protein D [Ruminococcaceae bacterium]|nr:stage III sporulation protein D [Oscillospiraceae bacterium]
MRELSDNRAVDLGKYIIKTGATVRATARVFHISKSTVHKDISQRLIKIDPILYKSVKKVMDTNRSERHIRGGDATRRKYLLKRSLKKEIPDR